VEGVGLILKWVELLQPDDADVLEERSVWVELALDRIAVIEMQVVVQALRAWPMIWAEQQNQRAIIDRVKIEEVMQPPLMQ
jgi:hypothetical protein